ncbi:MAG: Prephenate dehydrogenase, partial [Myxococcaceae bacterium]|nr:Prephenate dehydrogenase [Myxococcaceae bacterium]
FLVLADACGLAECLVDALGEERCLLVRASEARVSQVCLRAEVQSGSLLEQAFSELAEASELELHVIDLSGYGRAPEPWQLASGELLRGAIDAINELLAEIARHPERARIAKLSVVASHSQRVDARDRLCPVRSLLPALLAAAALELPALRVAQVDLEPCAADDALALTARASLLARELQHDAPERELCYRGSQRYALRLQHGRPVDVAPAALARGGLYVVTGGLGGLGVELARYLLTQLDARVLLVGKSALDEPRSARLDALRALGEVAYAAVDVADASRLQAAVESAERTWEGPLSGVFHLAGVYREASDLAEHGATSWQVMRAKVLGALAIQSLLAARPSALVVHYSSLASVLPNERAAAYAAANRFLDGLSHHQRDELGLASYALGFSAWHEVGMNAEGLHEPLLRRRGLYAIAPSAGLSSLLMVLGGAPSNTLVGVRADSPALRHRFDGPALPLQELRGFYTQSTSAVKLPRQLLAQGSPLSLERRQSMPLDERQQLDREQLHRLLLDQGELRVAPENALEEQLLGLWKRVLKLQNLGVCCDFFMQGGHSLLAAELVHDINQCFGNKFPLSLIFEARTVREQARSIDSGKHGTGVSVVPLQPLGSEPPLFCICGINIYQELASALAPEIPVYGVLLPVEGELLEGQSVELNVPAMARQYVSAIRGKQASGPYRVLGLSFGGALAYEVAQQLRRAGAEVSLLTMLDFVHPAGRRRSLLKLASHELSRLKRDRGLWLRRARELTSRVLPQAAHESQSVEPQRAREGVRQSAYAKAWAEYEPSLCPYPGKVLVIRAEDQSMWDGFDVAPDLGWSRFVSELQHRDVPGDHLSILRAPNVARLAGHLREALHAAGSKSPAQAALPSELSTRDVGTLREQIDELDRSLLELLGQRMTVVSQLASTKHEQGLPVRDGERERELLDSRAVWARQQQLPDELVRPLFGVIMRASRERQVAQMAALTAPDEHKTIAVIGAHGGMGKRMCALFEGLGHRVLAVDRTTSLTAEQAAQRADVTLIAVPITATEQVLREVGPHVPAHGLLMDISSLKQRPLETMLACTAASVLGTHPMFGPLVRTLHGQRVVLCPGRGDAWLRWAERTFQAGGLVTAQSTAEEHDRAMAEVQVLSHFQTEVMGLTLARLGTPLEQSLRFSTPPYLMELYMAARHFSQDSSLYSSISMDNPRTEQITQAFLDATSSLREILLTRDKEGLASVFTQVRSFLGSFGPHAVEQSKHLVASLAEPS